MNSTQRTSLLFLFVSAATSGANATCTTTAGPNGTTTSCVPVPPPVSSPAPAQSPAPSLSNEVNIETQRNAPGLAPASIIGAGVYNCYDKNGYAFGVSTVFQLAGVTASWSTDAKEIAGCNDILNKRLAGQIGLSSSDPALNLLGVAALKLNPEMNYLRSPQGQEDLKLFGQRAQQTYIQPKATPTSITFVFPAAPKGEGQSEAKLLPCKGKKAGKIVDGEYVTVNGALVCMIGGDSPAP